MILKTRLTWRQICKYIGTKENWSFLVTTLCMHFCFSNVTFLFRNVFAIRAFVKLFSNAYNFVLFLCVVDKMQNRVQIEPLWDTLGW